MERRTTWLQIETFKCETDKQLYKLKINVPAQLQASKYFCHKMDTESYKMLPEMYQQ